MASNRIDINSATVDDFELLFGIGRNKAEAIVRHRKVRMAICMTYHVKNNFHRGYRPGLTNI